MKVNQCHSRNTSGTRPTIHHNPWREFFHKWNPASTPKIINKNKKKPTQRPCRMFRPRVIPETNSKLNHLPKVTNFVLSYSKKINGDRKITKRPITSDWNTESRDSFLQLWRTCSVDQFESPLSWSLLPYWDPTTPTTCSPLTTNHIVTRMRFSLAPSPRPEPSGLSKLDWVQELKRRGRCKTRDVTVRSQAGLRSFWSIFVFNRSIRCLPFLHSSTLNPCF